MKRILIGTVVGAVIFFAYQSIMWTGGFHNNLSNFTPNQDTVIGSLDKNLATDGLYMIPWADPESPDKSKAQEELLKKYDGKPWAMIFFHKKMPTMETSAIIMGFIYTIISSLFVVLILYYGNFSSFGTRFLVSMAFAAFALTQGVFDDMNWWSFPWSFIKPQVIDLTFGWALCSLWFARYVKKAIPAVTP